MLDRVVGNPLAGGAVPPPASTIAFHRQLPGYAPTPLHRPRDLAGALGLDDLLVKDESRRFGLPAFKFLGASWAVAQLLGGSSDLGRLSEQARAAGVRRLTTATDGNHGRAVARMARLLGLEATIYVPAFIADARRQAIADEGAAVVVIAEGYDAAVTASLLDATRDPSARAVNDADLDGTSPVGGWVIDGYGTLFAELDAQLAAEGARPDAIVLQLGVGAFAAAGVRWAAAHGIRAIGAEPRGAACVAESIAAGRPVTVTGTHTTMACLDAGTPSGSAWPTLLAGLEAVIVLEDLESDEAMRRLAAAGIEAGESGAAGAAGAFALARDPRCARLAQGIRSTVVVATEGATDPVRYAAVLGEPPH